MEVIELVCDMEACVLIAISPLLIIVVSRAIGVGGFVVIVRVSHTIGVGGLVVVVGVRRGREL
jgi:hypothetical protein